MINKTKEDFSPETGSWQIGLKGLRGILKYKASCKALANNSSSLSLSFKSQSSSLFNPGLGSLKPRVTNRGLFSPKS